MTIFLIILAVCVIPPILNMLYLYITLKFNCWTWISEAAFRDGWDGNISHADVKASLIPFTSAVIMAMILAAHICTVLYYIVKYIFKPFVFVLNVISRRFMKLFTKMEDKNEFYEKLNNHCK